METGAARTWSKQPAGPRNLFHRSFALAVLLAATLPAALVPRLAFEQVIDASPRIVHGRILGSETGSSGRFIWTHYRVQVLDSLRGTLPAEITVSEPGGTLAGQTMQFDGSVQFRPGEELVLFLYRTPIGYWRTIGYWQGKFDVIESEGVQRIHAHSLPPDPVPAQGRDALRQAGTPLQSVDGLTLAQFKAVVRGRVRR